MDTVLYALARVFLGLIQVLPLRWVARLGRWGGGLAYWLDGRHRRVAHENLTRCFGPERTPSAIAALAKEHFRRLGENYACGVRTAAMTGPAIRRFLAVAGHDKILAVMGDQSRSCVMAIGHFGNFELYAHARHFVPGFQFATTYRALPHPSLNRLLQRVREQSGCLYFERLTEAGAMRDALQRHRLMLGFLADQHAGDRGLKLPFFGQDCSTSAAPAVYALRYQLPLLTAICYRTGLGQWRIEIGDEIPTTVAGHPRALEAIALDMNRAFEAAVRRDPANWFWVHRRWKPGRHRGRQQGACRASPATASPESESQSIP